ncbi:MAG: GxxExxY protein [Opitutaceae bacterium]|nr:GxxExxY protein [Opitutaceae bacterium]
MNQAFDDPLTGKILAAAISVHRELGPGFLESIYEEAMAIALTEAGLRFRRQWVVPLHFHGQAVGEHRLDYLVEESVVLELKAIKAFEDVHFAIVRSYLRASGASRGLLINFSAPTLQVRRIGPEYRPNS